MWPVCIANWAIVPISVSAYQSGTSPTTLLLTWASAIMHSICETTRFYVSTEMVKFWPTAFKSISASTTAFFVRTCTFSMTKTSAYQSWQIYAKQWTQMDNVCNAKIPITYRKDSASPSLLSASTTPKDAPNVLPPSNWSTESASTPTARPSTPSLATAKSAPSTTRSTPVESASTLTRIARPPI